MVAGFIALYGMQLIMSVLLVRPDGIRMHAPAPGTQLPLSTTVVGDAWMKAGVAAISVLVRDASTGAAWRVQAVRDTVKYDGVPVSVLAAYRAKVQFPAAGTYLVSVVATGPDGRAIQSPARNVSVSPTAASHEFVFGSIAHVIPILLVLAACILRPLLVKR